MAEILGLVSGSITVAETGSAVLKLKRLWNELSLVHPLLTETETELQGDERLLTSSRAARLSWTYCKKILWDLDGLAHDLRQQIESKRRMTRGKARVKIILGKETIRDVQKRMQDALQLLGIAQQTYIMQSCHTLTIDLPQLTLNSLPFSDPNTALAYQEGLGHMCSKGKSRLDVFHPAGQIAKLFEERQASPYDRYPKGGTLLHLALPSGNQQTVAYLVNKRLSLHERNDLGFTALDIHVLDEFTDIVATLFDPREEYKVKDVLRASLFRVPGLIDVVIEEFRQAPLEHRYISTTKWLYTYPKLFYDILQTDGMVDAELLRQQLFGRRHSSLHKFVLAYFGNAFCLPENNRMVWGLKEAKFQQWRTLARWLLEGVKPEVLRDTDLLRLPGYYASISLRPADSAQGNILFTDFGLSLDFTDANGSTTSGMANGRTERYCAPEVARFQPRNTSSDVWSLGLVFLEPTVILKGKPLSWMDDYLISHGSHEPFVSRNPTGLLGLLAELEQGTEKPSDNGPLDWIRGMLQEDQKLRPTAARLVMEITGPTSDATFCGICCIVSNEATDTLHSL
ncbi:hypothetical protein BJX63DRAFT_435951 [Aspergillus granulosus]|uniref:Protein kinase domain-containing protein n=1 Tax=Aspergillus granulosus TaxID=176169 RepID=A0ABR4GZK9_9EURO